MKKSLTLLITLIILSQISFGQAHIKVVLHSITGYGTHEEFAKRAAAAFEKVLQSDKFHQAVLAGNYKKTDGYSNQVLYGIIMKAHEVVGSGGVDSVVDLNVRTIRIDGDESSWAGDCDPNQNISTVGIDGAADGVMAICPQALDYWAAKDDVASLAGHYAHEYMHLLGFNHKKFLSTQNWRDQTFVYKIGYMVRDMIKADPTLLAP